MQAGQLGRIRGVSPAQTGEIGGSMLDQLAGYGSMDLLALGTSVSANQRSNAVTLVSNVIAARKRSEDTALQNLAA